MFRNFTSISTLVNTLCVLRPRGAVEHYNIHKRARIGPQIREQMYLETHFQYEYSILGHFWAVCSAEKKIQTAISMHAT